MEMHKSDFASVDAHRDVFAVLTVLRNEDKMSCSSHSSAPTLNLLITSPTLY